MTAQDIEVICELYLGLRKARIEELKAIEDFLLQHGRIQRRAVVSRNMLKKGEQPPALQCQRQNSSS